MLAAELKKRGLDEEIKIVETGCMGPCDLGPVMLVHPEGTFYQRVTALEVPKLVEEHFLKGRPYTKLLPQGRRHRQCRHHPARFRVLQPNREIVLDNCGLIDAENIEEYIARDGYAALGKVLTSMKPEQVIAEIKASGLRGRGGAGFPTGVKWELMAQGARSPRNTSICNADEGDPGAFMNRAVLEGDPHSVLEGMAIGAYAMGANRGFIYIRAEYPLAIKRLHIAIDQAYKHGLLGKKLFESGFRFRHRNPHRRGRVCVRRGNRADAQHRRPARPAAAASAVPGPARAVGQADQYQQRRDLGHHPADHSEGREVVRLLRHREDQGHQGLRARRQNPQHRPGRSAVSARRCGKSFSTSAAAFPTARQFKAVQTGGPSGGVIPAQHLDTPVDYESLQKLGSIMGSGGMVVMDEDSCMVDIARFFMDFCCDESCGKCPPCRVGTRQMLNILDRICTGEAELDDIEKLEELATVVRDASLCGLGQTAPNPVLTTLRYFRDEYLAHVVEKRCPARVCRELLEFRINEEKCVGCSMCFRGCPVHTIFKRDGQKKYYIVEDACIQCGACFDVCKFNAVLKTSDGVNARAVAPAALETSSTRATKPVMEK